MTFLVGLGQALHAQAQPASPPNMSPRGALHDGYGRMVFDWDSPVSYSADVINGELVLRFDRPVTGEFRNLLRPLSRYLRSVSVSADRKTATFPLARPIQVKAFAGNSNSVVVDLMDLAEGSNSSQAQAPPPTESQAPNGQSAPIPLVPRNVQGNPPATKSTAAAAPAAAPAPAPSPSAAPAASSAAGQPPSVAVRTGEHGTYNRLVFDWPRQVGYHVEKDGGRASIVFDRSGRIDAADLKASLPSDISLSSVDGASKATKVVLNIPAGSRLRHFASGNKVVVDVVRAAGAEAPAEAKPLASQSEQDVQLPSLKPLTHDEKPSLPSETLAASAPPSALSPVKPIPESKPAAKALAAKAPAPDQHGKHPADHPGEGSQGASEAGAKAGQPGKVFSLSVAWDKPVAAAVFQRAGYLWMVFDRRQEVDTKLIRRLGGEAVTGVEQIPNKEATVLRLLVNPEYAPSVRRDGLLWVVDLMHQQAAPKQPIAVTAPATLPTGIGMMLAAPEAGSVVSVTDPEVGDNMLVVPVITLGAGVYPGRSSPDLDLLPTVQGIAIVPHADGLDVRSSRSGVSIGMPAGAGLMLSSAAGQQPARADLDTGFLDVAAWKRNPDDFPAERRTVEAGLVGLPQARRAGAHMQAARLFFANGYAAEALGYLGLAASDDPTLVDTGAFRALRGACETLMERWDLAQADLDHPSVKDDAESQFWRAAAHAGGSDAPDAEDKQLAIGLPLLKDYPDRLKWPIATIAVKAAIAAGDDGAAQHALGVLDRLPANPAHATQLNYLHGAYEEMAGQFAKALADYEKAAKGDNREYRAKAALASAELQLKTKRINPQEAIEKLDRLRFAWREEAFEFGLLRRLAELQLHIGDYPEALRTLRSLSANYPDNKDAPVVSKMMSDTFAKLYLEGAADRMSPVSAIGLYDEFRDLTPSGPKGDEMIRKLADRLASVDLLDRAAELLKHQVGFRLQGLDKARVGTQLALLDLLNQQPQGALEALQTSEMDGLPAELQQQRRHMKARALADLGHVPDAIQLLAGDTSTEAGLLRAEIYWHQKDWLNAASAFEALVPRPEQGAALDDASARLVLSWATALTLGNDERGLASLRRIYGPAMAATSYKDGFSLLTSALDRDLPDMAAVASKVKEAESFLSFMNNYKQRMQSTGLSAIN